ncbi:MULTISPECIES: 3-keto-disaccharide hydrolase [Sphingobacterium]|jgi:hypothetical protein|uniref:3-keto-disaccharide hydrolase n=1 Tax=Sphingobacterium TaxID=28453 RepID=UPI000B9B807F|nr:MULTISPECIES: DUF1080 domain-containing protein [Sphingobacterium]UXD69902.1 DUF1080 domain-containing protein [Sphingobacterium faecium]WGQ13450.1 DUF1080 domain-containing protein [Sphingobacterium faecium]HCU44519.1 DUF1080 domain-containing protein [Sphingobacterium sp.]
MKLRTIVLAATMLAGTASVGTAVAQQKKEVPAYKVLDLPKVDLKNFKKNKQGAYIIFDGTSMTGWRGYNKTVVPKKWTVDEGAIKFDSKANVGNDEGGDLIFAHDFKNFELELEWKVAKGANSGIFFLAKEIEGQPIYISSPECQVLDNENHPDAKMGVDGNRKSTSLYDMIPAKPQNGKPFGEWNKVKIVVNNGKVEHWQNGVKVVTYTLWDQSWIDLLQKSKFSEAKWPLAYELLKNVGGKTKSGVIGFQDHGDDVWFKNITVKKL